MDKTIQGLTNLSNLTNDDLLVAWDSTEADENNRTKKISPDVMSKYVGVAGQNSAIITSNTKDISITMPGKQANDGMILCLTFTQAITGQSADTMTLSFNGESPKTIKVAKNGVLENFTPFDVSGTYTFLQAYTNLLLQRDETDNCYLIVGNPQVYKTNDYTIYADGRIVYNSSLKVKDFADFNEAIPLGNTFECFLSSYKPSNSPKNDTNYWYCITMKYNNYGLTNTMQMAISLNSADVYVRVIGGYSWKQL